MKYFNREASQNLKVILFLLFLYTVSIKMILHLTFLSSNFSLLYFIIIFFFLSIWTKYSTFVPILGASQVMVVVKNIPANAGDKRRLRFDP